VSVSFLVTFTELTWCADKMRDQHILIPRAKGGWNDSRDSRRKV
jgi:hypothetical protein